MVKQKKHNKTKKPGRPPLKSQILLEGTGNGKKFFFSFSGLSQRIAGKWVWEFQLEKLGLLSLAYTDLSSEVKVRHKPASHSCDELTFHCQWAELHPWGQPRPGTPSTHYLGREHCLYQGQLQPPADPGSAGGEGSSVLRPESRHREAAVGMGQPPRTSKAYPQE